MHQEIGKDAKIVIVGAGAAGLSAAGALSKKGYANITVLEKRQDAGGQCKTVTADGLSMDVGAVYILPNYPTITRFAREAGIGPRKSFPFEHLTRNGSYRPFGLPQPPLMTKAAEYLRLGMELIGNYPALYQPFGEWDEKITRALAEPFGAWMEKHRLDYFREAAYPLLRSFGFGYEAQQIPAAYIVNTFTKLARGGNLLSLWDVPSITLYHLEEGYGEIWKRAAPSLNVRFGVDIQRIERGEKGGVVHTGQGTVEFDKLIVTSSLPSALAFMDVSSTEAELFGKIQSFDVWQIAARVEGLRDAVIIDENQEAASIGKTMILFRYKGGSDWYYLFGYDRAGSPQTDQEILLSAQETVAKMGGRINGEPHLTRWVDYFPHYKSTEFAQGYHKRLNALQGKRSTYYAGAIFANIGVEAAAVYAERMAMKYF